ncbi:MAG: DUF4011 domain-containing protein, partial [Coriobacteriales bacterium]|nr:DUF4011 domain-containing protein [Coriobacteriales bacterium]
TTKLSSDPTITNQSAAETHKTLKNLRQKARVYTEEKGLNALHLAFGFINWRDIKDGGDLRSPLLLVPVELSQKDLFSPFVLSRHDDEITPNYALAQKLEIEAGIILPDYSEETGLIEYVEKISAACQSLQCTIDWQVELSLFSFNKINMYQDLDKHRQSLTDHPVVRALAGDASLLNQGLAGIDLSRFDHDAVAPSSVFSVLDGDSSQQDAVQLAKLGASFVLQGPPGTGKSQTITNIIAEFLAEGKRVLFVSEKLAALEVVKRRLTQVGLGDFCLTLHHHNAKRRDILDQLDSSLQLAQRQATVTNSAYDQLSKLMDSRKLLNNYSRGLHTMINPLGETFYAVFARLARLDDIPVIAFTPENAGSYTAKDLADRTSLLESLSRLVTQRGYQADNPWWGCRLRSLTNQVRQQITSESETILRLIGAARAYPHEIEAAMNRQQVNATAVYSQRNETAADQSHTTHNRDSTRPITADLSLVDLGRLSELYLLQQQLATKRQAIQSGFSNQVFEINGEELLSRCRSTYAGFMRGFNSDYRIDRAKVAAARQDGRKPSFDEVAQLAESLADFQALESEVRQRLAAAADKLVCPTAVAHQVFTGLNAHVNWYASLFEQAPAILAKPLDAVYDLVARSMHSFSDLEDYIDYLGILDKSVGLGIYGFIGLLAQASVPAGAIVGAFEKCFYRAWLDAVLPDWPAIQSFRRINHDALVLSFRELDKAHLDIAKVGAYSRLVDRLPALDTFYSEYDEVGRLKREMSKKRKLMPTRKLIAEIPNLLPVLKPCLMMSPLSVSTFLADNDYQFDIVLFDEASQIRTEDAICAIFRARQSIIVGDSRQLPPTDFFQTTFYGTDDDIYDEESGLGDTGAFESLLDEASLMPSQDLLWHYRSKHESLIAFSNAKLYNSKLTTFPSALDKDEDLGVEYIHVQGGVYERGLRRNLAEAQKVAELVFMHIARHPDRSLGIVAFGEGQQMAIEDALQQKRRLNPEFEYFFNNDSSEPVFLKNLETVQGDERDTIIFSIGYGYDTDGKFLMNFGPLSQEGGQRRLNVAITRAKINVKLVGSIMPYDIIIDRTRFEGPRLLRDYIEYAINGVNTIKTDTTDSPVTGVTTGLEASFETTVADFLAANGFSVEKNVGCSGYRLDMAIRHPIHQGSYAIAIECDGLTYSRARTARDRDRQRPTVLQGMGWTLYRIWSADWVKDPKSEGAKLLTAIHDAIDNYQKTVISGVLTPAVVREPEVVASDSGNAASRDESAVREPEVAAREPGEVAARDPEVVDYEPARTVSEFQDEVLKQAETDRAAAADNSPFTAQVIAPEYLAITDRAENDAALPFTRYKGYSADQIPINDFERVILEIIDHSYGIDREGLYKTLALCYGWARRGALINSRFDIALHRLLRANRLRESNGRLEAGNGVM